jgi:hypothetical protein
MGKGPSRVNRPNPSAQDGEAVPVAMHYPVIAVLVTAIVRPWGRFVCRVGVLTM